MIICQSSADLTMHLSSIQATASTVGFVPTMGALHQGHISLLNCAKKTTDFSVVSIFVNPTQFNDLEDYKKYPRDVEHDLQRLEAAGCHLVFLPSQDDIYPGGAVEKEYDLGGLDEVMEGPMRPGHFNGVAMVVHRLFQLVQPTDAFFGEKGFQQLAIITYLVRSLQLNVTIHGCPILREVNGLAMSSRNERLTPEQRANAATIYATLQLAREYWHNFTFTSEIKEFVVNKINENPYLEVEYFDLVEARTLEEIENIDEADEPVGCVAAYAGNIRLIDNIRFYS
ncbi:MAG TPA: pantoate--beta-alanine ligase [Bacteroidales bacterium]|nr:pantoate--beta-alanine ligase [Bacteroidales bacterium]